jgi:Zn-dependent protease
VALGHDGGIHAPVLLCPKGGGFNVPMSSDLDLVTGIICYIVFVYSTVCHEAGHAWTAQKLGDDTAYLGGQVSLDPTPHIRREPFGMVIVPILSFLLGGGLFGWASVPIDPAWAQRHPRRAAWMSLAGPAANLALVLGAALLIRVGVEWHVFTSPDSANRFHVTEALNGKGWEFAALFLSIVFSLNLLLFVFNLIPVPPLDGSSAIMLFMGENLASKYQEFLANGAFRIFGIFIAWQVIQQIYGPIFFTALGLLYPGVNYYSAR